MITRDETSETVLLGFFAKVDESYREDEDDDTVLYDVGACIYNGHVQAEYEDPFEFYAFYDSMTHAEALARCKELIDRHLLDIGQRVRV